MLKRTAPVIAAICLIPFANSLAPASPIPTEGSEMVGDDGSFDIRVEALGIVALGAPHTLVVEVSPHRDVLPPVLIAVAS